MTHGMIEEHIDNEAEAALEDKPAPQGSSSPQSDSTPQGNPTPKDHAGSIPPLAKQEGPVLAFNLLITQMIFLALGIVGTIAITGLATGDWIGAILGGWARTIGSSFTALPKEQVIPIAFVFAAACCAGAVISERRALRSESGRKSVYSSRQGINGELPRLPLVVIVVLMGVVGLSEELLFRYVIVGLTCVLLMPALPPFIAVPIALFISSVVFWFAHARYRDLATMVLTLALGLALGILFVATGSLAAVALSHALYDIAVLVVMRMQMKRDPDYFGGVIPTRILLDTDTDEKKSPSKEEADNADETTPAPNEAGNS